MARKPKLTSLLYYVAGGVAVLCGGVFIGFAIVKLTKVRAGSDGVACGESEPTVTEQRATELAPEDVVTQLIRITGISEQTGAPTGTVRMSVGPEVMSHLRTAAGKEATRRDVIDLRVTFPEIDSTLPIGQMVAKAAATGQEEVQTFPLTVRSFSWTARGYPLDSYDFEYDASLPTGDTTYRLDAKTSQPAIPTRVEVSCDALADSFELFVRSDSERDMFSPSIRFHARRDWLTTGFVIVLLVLTIGAVAAFAARIGATGGTNAAVGDATAIVLAVIAVVSIRSVLVPASVALPSLADLALLSAVALAVMGVTKPGHGNALPPPPPSPPSHPTDPVDEADEVARP